MCGSWWSALLVAAALALVACKSGGSEDDGPGGQGTVGAEDPQSGEGQGGGGSSSAGEGGASGGGAGEGGASGSPMGGAGSSGMTSEGGSGGSNTDPMPIAELPDAFASAICDALESCVGAAKLRDLTKREDCDERVAAELRATDFAHMDMAISAGRVLYDPSKLAACLDGVRALECDVLADSFPQPCVDVLAGNVALGDECMISAECQGTAFCKGTTACPSTCAELLGENAACTGDGDCGDDLLCVGGACRRPAADGAACAGNSGAFCGLGLSCLGSTDTLAGQCTPNSEVQVGAEGASCDPIGTLCREGLSCVFDGGSGFHCEGPVASGGACHLGLPGQCPIDEYCGAMEVTQASTCRELPSAGQACALGELCAAGLACVQEGSAFTCRAIEDNGGDCAADQACRSGNCTAGKCAPPPICN
jgi:hypothetical protein